MQQLELRSQLAISCGGSITVSGSSKQGWPLTSARTRRETRFLLEIGCQAARLAAGNIDEIDHLSTSASGPGRLLRPFRDCAQRKASIVRPRVHCVVDHGELGNT